MRKQLCLLFIVLFFSASIRAQFNLGVATGNWSGMEALRLNPANIADNHERFVINIVSGNVGIENNLGTIKSSGGLYNSLKDGDVNSIFSYSGNSRFSLLAPYANIQLPGVMVSINHKHSVALTTGIRGMSQFNNFDRSLFRTVTDTAYMPNGNLDLTSNRFNYTAHVWSEVGITYAGVLLDQGEHEIKAGITLRYLGGIGYLGLKGYNLDAHYKSGSDSLFVNHSDIEFASNILSTRSALLNGFSNHNIMDEFFGSKDGSGFGADLGIVYDFMPTFDIDGPIRNNLRNRYKLRVAISVIDIGSITYDKSSNANANLTGNGFISGSDFSKNVTNFEDFRHYAVAHGFTADTSHRNTTVYMPTTLHVAADYKIYKHFFANATFIANLANRQAFGNSYYNQLTITPRYDTRLYSIGLPITYSVLDKNMKAGVGIRITGFFIGSDDIMGIFTSHQNGFNLYVGGFVPFHKHRVHHVAHWDGNHIPSREPNMDNEEHGDSTGHGMSFSGRVLNVNGPAAATETALNTDNTSADNRKYVHEVMEAEQH